MSGTYNISNVKNFYSTFDKKNIKDIQEKYSLLVSEFLLCAIENIVVQNEKYLMFIIQRGLETLKHCFKMIYMYTRNLELTIFHCKKAYCYYVEFIGQIGEDSHSYLQLNSKDATLFVYKKTIFEIDNDYRKKYQIEDGNNIYIKLVSNVIDIFHEIVLSMITKEVNFSEKKESIIHFCMKQGAKIIDKLYNKDISLKENLNNTVLVLYFIYAIKDPSIENIKYSNICESFIKKIKKKTITMDILQEKLYRTEYNRYVKDYTALKFVNWLFSNN
jgi:hypothetical protein